MHSELPTARVLIVGVSVRAAAESAARAGFDVTALDGFGDLDQHAAVQSLSLPRDFGVPFTPRAAACVARDISSGAAVYLSGFENAPRAVSALASGRTLWGNPPEVLRRVRDPFELARVLHRRGFAVPNAPNPPSPSGFGVAGPSPLGFGAASAGAPNAEYLLKPLSSCGGQRVRAWRAGMPVPRGYYVQQFVSGIPASIVFVSANRRAVPIGMSRQLVGEVAFGAGGFTYCGSILTTFAGLPSDRRALVADASALASTVTEEFDLVGVGGIDFIVHDGRACPLEVNPRWSASMELVERVYGLSVFGAHVAACRDRVLPAFDWERAGAASPTHGKAVVFARGDVVARDTRAWLERPDIRDVPQPGERIKAGHPVCTVFADAADEGACHAALVRRAEDVYAEMAGW